MLISHSNRFVYIRSQKTASTATQIFLSNYCNSDDYLYLTKPLFMDKISPKINVKIVGDINKDHTSIDYVLDKFPQTKNYTFITSVRNPIDVEFSRWKYHGKPLTFSKKLDYYLSQPNYNQEKYIFKKDGNIGIDFFIKRETFESDLKLLCNKFDWEFKKPEYLNSTKELDFKISESDFKKIYSKYKKIFELFNYKNLYN